MMRKQGSMLRSLLATHEAAREIHRSRETVNLPPHAVRTLLLLRSCCRRLRLAKSLLPSSLLLSQLLVQSLPSGCRRETRREAKSSSCQLMKSLFPFDFVWKFLAVTSPPCLDDTRRYFFFFFQKESPGDGWRITWIPW